MKALRAKLLLVDIRCFEHSVRVKDEPVADLNGKRERGVGGKSESGEHESVFSYLDDVAIADQEHGRVSSSRVAQLLGLRVEINIPSGDKLVLSIATKGTVHAKQKRRGVFGIGALSICRKLHHRGD